MAVMDNYAAIVYVSVGLKRYSFDWAIIKPTHLRVGVVNLDLETTELVYGEDYVLIPKSDYTMGGDVELTQSYPNGYKIVLWRNTPLTQDIDFGRQLNFSFDKLTIIAQDLTDKNKRMVKIPAYAVSLDGEIDVSSPPEDGNIIYLKEIEPNKFKISLSDTPLNYVLNLVTQSTETKLGVAKLASQADAESMNNNDKIMTPLRVKQTADILVASEANIRNQADILLQDGINTLHTEDLTLQKQINELQGLGGALPHTDFETSTPTQEQLTLYACQCIWGDGGTFIFNASDPAESSYEETDGTIRYAKEIFNSTWIRNDFDNHKLVLNNTQNTTPKVFDWTDVGIDTVSIANDATAGVVKAGVSNTGLAITLDGTLSANTDNTTMIIDENNRITSKIKVDGEEPKQDNGGNIITKREMTYNEYIALSEEERMKNIEYHITDLPGEGTPVLGVASFIGSLQYGIRTDNPLGYLRCDGNEYPASSYAEFINQHLLTGKIPYISLENYQAQLNNNDDNCACFGYDNPDSGGNGLILRVPRLKDNTFIAQALTAGDIGKFNKEGLPNITGSIKLGRNNYSDIEGTEGAITAESYTNTINGYNNSGNVAKTKLNINASNSNAIYGNSEHVTPNHMQYPLFVCVSNQSQPIIEDNVNLFVDGLNNKVNLDGTNLNITAKDSLNEATKQTLSYLALPSSNYVDLTLKPDGGEYVMPANGYLFIRKKCNGNNQYISVSNATCGGMGFCIPGTFSGFGINITVPVKKNDVILIDYTAGGATDYFRFIYAEGETPAGGS